jgi:hypothetical protein
LLRLVIICLIGSNSYKFYFILHVALESCFKYIFVVELLDNIQFAVWSSFRDYQECKSILFLYYISSVLVCQYIVSRIVYRGNSVVCFTKATSPPRNIFLSTFAPSRKTRPLSTTHVNWSFHPRWCHRGKEYLLSLQSICVFYNDISWTRLIYVCWTRCSVEILVEKINICVLNIFLIVYICTYT